jgi:hypothetical protein
MPTETLADESAPAAVEVPPPAPVPAVTPPPAPVSAPSGGARRSDDAINLGSTVLPVLFKSYWKQALVALVVIVLIIWLIAAL